MDEQGKNRAANFIQYCSIDAFPPTAQYLVDTNGNYLNANSNEEFRNNRKKQMNLYIDGNPKHESIRGLFVEPLVCFSLRPYLQQAGFDIILAPQSLEHGIEQKGVDLLIVDPDQYVYLGIDVKTRKDRSSKGRDRYGWSSKLKSPYIFLSLGNWDVELRENKKITVPRWTREMVVPNIQKTGKIPRINNFKDYIVSKAENTVYSFRNRLDDRKRYYGGSLPQNREERTMLEEKLGIIHSLLTDISLSV